MSETPEMSGKSLPLICATELKEADSEEKSLKNSRKDDKFVSDNDKTSTSIKKNTNNVSDKDHSDKDVNLIPIDQVTELFEPILNDQKEETCKAEDVSTSLINSSITSYKDSDPCSEDMVLRYDESELSELDKTSDPVNDDSSQNNMDGSNDNIIEELDKIIAEDNENSNLDTKGDREFIDNDDQNDMILTDTDKPVESSIKSPVIDPIAAENTINIPENKSIDETEKNIIPQAEITEEINFDAGKKIAEHNTLQEMNVKIPETALMGAGDSFISNIIAVEKKQDSFNVDIVREFEFEASNFTQPPESDIGITHSINVNQESVMKEAITKVLPTTDDSFNSGIDEIMDVDEDVAPVMPESEPMEESNHDIIAAIENSTPVAPTLATDLKSEFKDADEELDDIIDTEPSESSCPAIPVTDSIALTRKTSKTELLETNISKNIKPTTSTDDCKLLKLDSAIDQDAKELTENNDPESTSKIDNINIPVQQLTEYLELKDNVAPKDSFDDNIDSLTAQKEQDITSENIIKDSELNSAETNVSNTLLTHKDDGQSALSKADNTTKVTDQLSVDIPKFSSKKSDMSKEVEPQALQLSKHSLKLRGSQGPKVENTEAEAMETVENLFKDDIQAQNLEIAQPESKSIELDLPSCELVETDKTKDQEMEILKIASELKDVEPQKTEVTQLVSKSTELDTPSSETSSVSKSEGMYIKESESVKPEIESKSPRTEINATACDSVKSVTKSPTTAESVEETKDLEHPKPEVAHASTDLEAMDTKTSETDQNAADRKSLAIPEKPNLKSPEPSTSKDSKSQEMQPDQSDEVPDTTDSLGLLAETFRSMEDGDEQEEDNEEPDDEDGEDGDEDDDFDDESNQVPDNSEDSNVATNSETDHDANLVEPSKSPLLQDVGKIDVVETPSGTLVEAITDIEIEENKVASDLDLGVLEQDELKLPKTPEQLSDIIVTNEDEVKKAETSIDDLPHLRAILTETQVPPETGKLTPTKAKKLEISKPKNVVNIVELEESSSEDDIQEVSRPVDTDDTTTKQTAAAIPKSVRINTSEITIKTATAESTLVIPEIRVGNVDKSKDSKPKCGLEVFSLDSDEDSSGKEKLESDSKAETKQPYLDSSKAGDCVNPTCDGTSSHYIKANAAILRYYDVKKKKRKRAVVCENCTYHVGSRMENLMEGVKCCETGLLSLHMERVGEQLVEISDSDTDSEGDDKPPNTVGDSGYSFLESTFADMVNATWLKYNLASRMADAKDEILDQIEQLEKDSKEIDDMLNSCQKLTDKVRNDLYATFARPIHNLPAIDIDQNCIVQTAAAAISTNDDSNSETDSQVRRSKRTRTSKDEPPNKRAAIPLPYKNNIEDPNADTKDSKDDDIRVVRLSSECAPVSLPPPGEYRRAALRVGMPVYGMRHTFGAWSLATIENVAPSDIPNFSTCRVKFENKVKGQFKQLLGRHLAYAEPADVRLTIGTRVIALFIDWSEHKKKTSFYSGVIAEVPNPVNVYRYLVFFDDGYAQYINHADIRVVCETSSLVWEEVHTFSREFVKSYLLAYPERPMVRLHSGQSLKTEWNGKWWPSKVIAVDASLVNVYFESDKRTEWIYRGSTRLAPLFLELQAAERPRNRALHSSANRHIKNMPYVEYTRTNEQEDEKATPDAQLHQEMEEIKRQRAVAKKSTIQPFQPQPPPSVHQSPSDSVLSRVVYYTPKAAVKPHRMQSHICSIDCKRTDVLPLNELRTYNPLARPLLSGWERQIVRFRFRKEVVYRAPCGRRLRNIKEIHRYLRDTYSDMSVDLFDFNSQTHCLAEFVLNRCLVSKKDLSHGKENVPVPCVNYYDSALPEFCSYNTERTPTQGVPLNTDPEFLCGCDCTDDCQDKSKCACWKLTMEGANTIGMDSTAGYVYKRLLEPVPSGIYECNSRCKCSKTCLNRVAQHPLQLKLQVFKTLNRGWGIRALNDVPKGAFLCVYAGNLLTDATANLDGLNEGDEYLAELDYIEVVEQMKEGYEDDIPDKDKQLDQKSTASSETSADEQSEDGDNEGGSERSKDEDFKPDLGKMGPTQHVFSKRLRKRSRKGQEDEKETERDKDKPRDKDGNEEDCITISDDEEVRQPSRFNAEAGMDPNEFVSKKRPLRSFFGKDEACYIMDAKVQGNIGRYLNHSCTPNVFVQNVFVDTHDPRFPWVAFFALSHIKAGTELTWNYNYDIGSVPGKILYCYCGAPNCRRRLL